MTTLASLSPTRLQIYSASQADGIQAGPGAYVQVDSVFNPGKGRFSITNWVVEFLASDVGTGAPYLIGDGTSQSIGLYGQDASDHAFLLGILGISQGAKFLQIPMYSDGTVQTGWSQVLNVTGVYTALTIGCIAGGIAALSSDITVCVRPIRSFKA